MIENDINILNNITIRKQIFLDMLNYRLYYEPKYQEYLKNGTVDKQLDSYFTIKDLPPSTLSAYEEYEQNGNLHYLIDEHSKHLI